MTRKLLFTALLLCVCFLSGHAQADDGLEVIMSENFDAFTEGSETEPGTTDISTPSYNCKLGNTLKGWRGANVFEAGGMLRIGTLGAAGSYIRTANYNMSANGGTVKVTLRIKSVASYGDLVTLALGYMSSKQIFLEDGEWHTLSFVLDRGSSSSYIELKPMTEGILLDEIKVETSPNLISAPTANQPSRADDESFSASWSKVTGATDYLLDVYTKTVTGDKDYLLKDETVKNTFMTVTGLVKGKTYYYTVRARKENGGVSDYSNEIEVVKVIDAIGAPVAKEATKVSQTGFVANWESVEDAMTYILNVYQTETLADDREVAVISEDFSGVTAGTLESVEFGRTQEYLDSYTRQPGWFAVNDCYAAGHIGISPYGDKGSVVTPELDLSKNGGVFTYKVRMAEGSFGRYYAGAKIDIILYSGEEEVEKKQVTLEEGFAGYDVEFTKGTTNSSISVEYGGDNKLFIDEISIMQKLKAGEKLTSLILKKEDIDDTSCGVELDNPNSDFDYSYNVQAVGRTVQNFNIVPILSANSNTVDVKLISTCISSVDCNATVSAAGGVVSVTLDTDSEIEVYGMGGQMIAKVNAAAGTTDINVGDRFVIVKVGGKAVKLTAK